MCESRSAQTKSSSLKITQVLKLEIEENDDSQFPNKIIKSWQHLSWLIHKGSNFEAQQSLGKGDR